MKFFQSFYQDQKGQALTEYALILALVAIIAIAALSPLGDKIAEIFTDITSSLGGTSSS